MSVGGGGVKGFFAHHIEKMITLLAFALAGVLFAMGYQVERLEEGVTPDRLVSLVQQSKTHIENPESWALIKGDREPARGYVEVLDSRPPITDTAYASKGVWTPHIPFRLEQRDDPPLFAPEMPEVSYFVAAVARRARSDETGALERQPFAPLEEEKPGRGRGKPDKEDEPSFRFDPKKHKAASFQLIGQIERQLDDSWKIGGKGSGSAKDLIVDGKNIVAVRAVIPWRKQWQAYRLVFQQAVGFDAARDQPDYIWFEMERADVTDDPDKELTDADWSTFVGRDTRLVDDNGWAEAAKDVYGKIVQHEKLTVPIPPTPLVDYGKHVVHSKIPRIVEKEKSLPKSGGERRAENVGPSGPGGPGGGPGVPDPSLEGGGFSGSDASGAGADPSGADPAGGADGAGFAADGAAGGGEPPAGGDGRGRSGGGRAGLPEYVEPPVDYKLIRTFDMTAERGKSYRYRVRVYLSDPNHPPSSTGSAGRKPRGQKQDTKLQDEMLVDTVVERLKAVREAERRSKRDINWRMTEWSEPSAAVTIPRHFREVYAGGTGAPNYVRINSKVGFERSEPYGEVVTTVWDETFAVRVPVKKQVFLGSVLNFTADADVLHPLTWQIHRLSSYPMRSDTMVLDIRGGEHMTTSDRETISLPGEVLLFDSDGKLAVQSEIEDLDNYRRYMLIDDGPPVKRSSSKEREEPGGPGSEGAAPGFGGFEGFGAAPDP